MEVKTIEGTEYILKTSVDELVRKRLSPMSERARTAEAKIDELQAAVDGAQDSSSRIAEHQARIAQLEDQISTSRARYESHTTISQHGFIDGNLRDMVASQYKIEMASRPKKNQQKLGDWLQHIKANPEEAPLSIRPHILSSNPPPPAIEAQSTAPHHQAHQAHQAPPPSPVPPPSPAAGVIPTNGTISTNLIENALRDQDLYRANHAEIKATWYAQRNRKPFM